MDRVAAYEAELLEYGKKALREVEGLTFIGTAEERTATFSFTLDSAHPHDIGQILDAEGIAIRAGHHCAQPVMKHFGVPATARASMAFYNTTEEIDALVEGLRKVNEVFA
jgi:cysteine desulfurase/selenocysteine lyase